MMAPACLRSLGVLAAGCSDSSDPDPEPLGYFVLTGTPTPATVFDAIAETYRFPNNLTNSIWQRQANVIVTGEFSESGYWAFAPMTAAYANQPDNGADIHARMVQVPATNTVVYSRSPSANGVGCRRDQRHLLRLVGGALLHARWVRRPGRCVGLRARRQRHAQLRCGLDGARAAVTT